MAYEIRGKHQLKRTRTAAAGADVLWQILADSRLLPAWVPAVRTVDRCDEGGETVGAVRHCSVELGGRAGKMIEECVDMAPGRSITYAVRDDSFGLAKMLSDYAFRISLEARDGRTAIAIDTYYTPRNLLYGFMNVAVMRRQFRSVIDRMLTGLCALAEKRSQPEI